MATKCSSISYIYSVFLCYLNGGIPRSIHQSKIGWHHIGFDIILADCIEMFLVLRLTRQNFNTPFNFNFNISINKRWFRNLGSDLFFIVWVPSILRNLSRLNGYRIACRYKRIFHCVSRLYTKRNKKCFVWETSLFV